MGVENNASNAVNGIDLFDRVVAILEQARSNVVRSVNSNMVLAYWLTGREIVEDIQTGEPRADYGKQVVERLSGELQNKYGRGYSTTNLWYFRKFYLMYSNSVQILHPRGEESEEFTKRHLSGGESATPPVNSSHSDNKLTVADGQGFNPNLSWSHYRALLQVKKRKVREFYEKEAVECGWNKKQLERQIRSSYYERIVNNSGEEGLVAAGRERLTGIPLSSTQLLKSPYVLEFLDLPDSPCLHETDVEQAIINNLQSFLLELGKGFSFVARQKQIRFEDDNFYIDLVFYNFILKCFVLIDLKIGKLTHADVGQMDGYVRLFEDRFKVEGDNPTIGLILCSDKSEAVARYSVLNESKQIFASKYLKFLPSEEELRIEIEKERELIEAAFDELNGANKEVWQSSQFKGNRK